jgi:hypothetical protein
LPSPTTDRLQGYSTSVAVKAPVRAATTANISLTAEQTIDGVAVVDGDRVLVKDQSTASQNGIYIVSTGSWTRAEDFDGNRDVVTGTALQVLNGTANANKWFNVTSADPVIGTSSITFGQTYVSLTAVSSATETAGGIAEIATLAETDTGTDDTRIVTPLKLSGSKYNPIGKHMLPVMATAMQSATTNGAAVGAVETSSNKVLYRTLDYDTSTQEFAGFGLPMPKSWNEGTVTFRARWTAASGSGGVAWALQALAVSDDDALDQAYGTEQVVTDTLIAADDLHITAESAAITIAGTPAEGDLVLFRIKRVPANASDTLGVDARLIAVDLFLTTNAGTDA